MHQHQALVDFVTESLEDMKAEEIIILPVSTMTTITDFMIICTGNSNQHVKSIAERLIQNAKQAGIEILSSEGKDTSDWVLVDFGDAIVHVMQPEARQYYELEKLWSVDECVSES